jgi:hypothetical protein
MNDCSICGKFLKEGQTNRCQSCKQIDSKKRVPRKDYRAMASGYAQGGGGGGGQVKRQGVRGGQGIMETDDIPQAPKAPKASRGRAKKQQTGGGSDMDLDAKFKSDIAKLDLPQLRLGFDDLKYIPQLKATIHFTPIKNPLRGIPNYSEEDPVYPLLSPKGKMKYICFYDGNVFDMRGSFIGNLNLQALK